MYHNTHITLRLPAATLDMIDTMRGGIPRGAYIRGIIDTYLYTEEELVEESTTEDDGGGAGRRTPHRGPSRPNHLAVVTPDRHLHHFVKEGEPLRYRKGTPWWLYRCAECGATKEDI